MAGTYTNLVYHVVFSTKGRRQLITSPIEAELHSYLGGIVRGIEGIPLAVNGLPDHIHLLAKLPPKIAVSAALREIKACSSKWLNERRSAQHKFAWQDGYAAFSVSRSQTESVSAYIRDQKTHHASRDYQSELLALLGKHDIDYDERYIWD
jgi:REP element-mobilizing transposase RayT